jgi:hypothetical protein
MVNHKRFVLQITTTDHSPDRPRLALWPNPRRDRRSGRDESRAGVIGHAFERQMHSRWRQPPAVRCARRIARRRYEFVDKQHCAPVRWSKKLELLYPEKVASFERRYPDAKAAVADDDLEACDPEELDDLATDLRRLLPV